jgi:hypothetical protein
MFEGFPEDDVFRSPLDHEFLYPGRATVVLDAPWLAASQYSLDGRFVPWGVAAPEGFYGGGPYSFGTRLPTGGICFSLSGEVEQYASAVCAIVSRKGCGPFRKGPLYGELFGCVVYRERGWSIKERAPVLAH